MKEYLEEVGIAVDTTTDARLQGSHGVMLRPRDDDDPDPDPDEDPIPPPPPIAVSVPDIGIQIIPCLEQVPGVPDEVDLEAEVIAAVRESFGEDADVRYSCENGSGRIGIWMRPSSGTAADEARNRGLSRLNLVKPNELYAIFVNASFIRRGREGTPPPAGTGGIESGGPVHLTSLKILFQAPDKVITRVEGYDERPWPDVDFTYDVTDKLSASGGNLLVDTTEDLDIHRSWLTYLMAAIIGVAGAVVSPAIWFLGGVPFLLQELAIRGKRPPGTKGAAGAAAAALLPGEIFLKGGSKVEATYERFEAAPGGIFAGGFLVVSDRTPGCRITGPEGLRVGPDENGASGEFHVGKGDLRAPITIVWEADGTILNQGSVNVTIGFELPEGKKRLDKTIKVTLTDADGLTVSDEHTVKLNRVNFDPELPPICKSKPWLDICNPPDL